MLFQIINEKAYQLLEDLNIVKFIEKTTSSEAKKSAHKFLGLISKTGIDLIDKAIEEDCETIDFDGRK